MDNERENFEMGNPYDRLEATEVFTEYCGEVDQEVADAKVRIDAAESEREQVPESEYALPRFRAYLAEAIYRGTGITVDANELDITEPPSGIEADFAVPMFKLAKAAQKSPADLAAAVSEAITEDDRQLIETAEATGPFVNLRLGEREFATEVIGQVLELGDRYGATDSGEGKTVIVDYSAPNIAKPMGVGHLRSTIIGESLARIYDETGYTVIRDNHLGDWGTQFGSVIAAYEKWGDPSLLEEHPVRNLKDLYVRYTAEAKENPAYAAKARETFMKLEEGDPELLETWKLFRDISMVELARMYERLGIDFDTTIGEGYFATSGNRIVDSLVERGLAVTEEGGGKAVAVEETDELPSFLLRKQDGSTLYAARDLATLRFRSEVFDPDDVIYVVGGEQSLNFKQVFTLAEEAGLTGGANLFHAEFGMLLSKGKKMSTRGGSLIELETLIEESVNKAAEIVAEKNPDLTPEEQERIAEQIGLGALFYNDLRQARHKTISFDWERMLDFESGSAAYLQYGHARIHSLLERAGEDVPADTEVILTSDSERQLAKKLSQFPFVIKRSRDENMPHFVCGYLEELTQSFSRFYNDVPILRAESDELRLSRLALSKSVGQVLKSGLRLLNIDAPERM
jgi:arginyl-tRNA synthetase